MFFLHNEVDNVYCMGEHWDLYAWMSYSVRRVFIDVITETVSYDPIQSFLYNYIRPFVSLLSLIAEICIEFNKWLKCRYARL